jgi:hypothetical protein
MFRQNFRYFSLRPDSSVGLGMKWSNPRQRVFMYMTTCSFVNVYGHLVGTFCLHFPHISSRRWVSRLLIFWIRGNVAPSFSEMSVAIHQSTLFYKPEESHLHRHYCETHNSGSIWNIPCSLKVIFVKLSSLRRKWLMQQGASLSRLTLGPLQARILTMIYFMMLPLAQIFVL